ncbi:MAG: hypothetical protein R6V73_12055 [Anaerolineales bacterium]
MARFNWAAQERANGRNPPLAKVQFRTLTSEVFPSGWQASSALE